MFIFSIYHLQQSYTGESILFIKAPDSDYDHNYQWANSVETYEEKVEVKQIYIYVNKTQNLNMIYITS